VEQIHAGPVPPVIPVIEGEKMALLGF